MKKIKVLTIQVIFIIFIFLIISLFIFQSCKEESDPGKEKIPEISNNGNDKTVQTQMKNVRFLIDEDIILHIKNLRGELIPDQKKDHPVFNDKNSFILNIASAEISIDTKSLSALLNRYVFGYKDSPLKNIKVTVSGNKLYQEGEMKGIPFSVLADISAAPGGKIKLHPAEMKAAGIGVEGIMEFFDLELDEMISLKEKYGAEVVNNDFYLDPSLMLPPPRIKGHLSSVRIQDGQLIQIFSNGSSSPLDPEIYESNYMYFNGGDLTFGKLTMDNADMQIIDEDPGDSFEFFLDHYLEQLVIGYHKTSRDEGLLIYMPDYNDLRKK